MLVRWSAFLSANKVGLLILSQENIHNSECLKENLKAVLMLFFFCLSEVMSLKSLYIIQIPVDFTVTF